MKHAEPLKSIKALEKTAGAIIETIQDCLVFLIGYGELSFSGILLKLWNISGYVNFASL